MKHKLSDILTCGLFCGFLVLVLALFLILPREDFSQREKRVLAAAPDGQIQNVLSGNWGVEAENYIADHIPGRDLFVGLNAYYDLLSGRQVTKSVYLASGDRLVEAPYAPNLATVTRNLQFIQSFAQTVGQPVDLMIVPSAGALLEGSILGLHDPYEDEKILSAVQSLAGSSLGYTDLLTAFRAAEDPGSLYYRTDHHWTSLGAYTAMSTYLRAKGRPVPAREGYTVESHDGFYGTTHSRSGLWAVPGEAVELWDDGGSYTVTAYQNHLDTQGVTHGGLFYRERLQELDKYTVYLNGNQPLVRIHNPQGQGSILVIRDSYANCLGTLLASGYETVVLVDLRYYKAPVSDLVKAEGFTDILVCYSLGNFMTDVNFPWLK